jgi:hypothetical protein
MSVLIVIVIVIRIRVLVMPARFVQTLEVIKRTQRLVW